MKNLLLILLGIILFSSCEVKKSSKLIWRNISWNVSEYPTFLFLYQIDEDVMVCYLPFENKCIGDQNVDSIRYFFYKNRLMSVNIYYTSKQFFDKKYSITNYDTFEDYINRNIKYYPDNNILSKYFKHKFGEYSNSTNYLNEIYEWNDGDISVVMGVKGIFFTNIILNKEYIDKIISNRRILDSLELDEKMYSKCGW